MDIVAHFEQNTNEERMNELSDLLQIADQSQITQIANLSQVTQIANLSRVTQIANLSRVTNYLYEEHYTIYVSIYNILDINTECLVMNESNWMEKFGSNEAMRLQIRNIHSNHKKSHSYITNRVYSTD
jgi:hypothetical protein